MERQRGQMEGGREEIIGVREREREREYEGEKEARRGEWGM